jgi:hypothetical protein
VGSPVSCTSSTLKLKENLFWKSVFSFTPAGATGAESAPPVCLQPRDTPKGQMVPLSLSCCTSKQAKHSEAPEHPELVPLAQLCTSPVCRRPTTGMKKFLSRRNLVSLTQGAPFQRYSSKGPGCTWLARRGGHSGWDQHPCRQLQWPLLGTTQVVALGTIIQRPES